MTTAVAKTTAVVDCDTHFWQPIALWEQYIPSRYKDAIIDYLTPKDETTRSIRAKVAPFAAIKGGDDPIERIKWMDGEGIYASIIYPTHSGLVTSLPDPDVVSAACRALNRWAANFASHNPRRLKPCMVLPFRYPERALEELRFAAEELKLEAVFAVPTPAPERRWSDRALDPLWQAMQDAGIVMTFHEFFQAPGKNVVTRESYKDSYPLMYLCGHTVEAQLCVTDVILGGVLERFPGLEMGFVEAHVAWLPGWLALMDSVWPKTSSFFTSMTGTGGLSMKPSEFFRRQCFIVAFPDDVWIAENVKYIGENNVTICTDYPHPQTRYQLLQQFDTHQPRLPQRVKRKVLGENARRIFKLKVK